MYKQTFKNENCELYKKLLINIRWSPQIDNTKKNSMEK